MLCLYTPYVKLITKEMRMGVRMEANAVDTGDILNSTHLARKGQTF